MQTSGPITVTSTGALTKNRLVRLTASGPAYAPASTSYADGYIRDNGVAGKSIEVYPLENAVIIEVEAAGTIGPGVPVFQAANGTASASGTLTFGRSHPDDVSKAAGETVRVIVNRSAN